MAYHAVRSTNCGLDHDDVERVGVFLVVNTPSSEPLVRAACSNANEGVPVHSWFAHDKLNGFELGGLRFGKSLARSCGIGNASGLVKTEQRDGDVAVASKHRGSRVT